MLTKEQALDLVDIALARGSEVAEMWAGTQYEKRIDFQQAQVIKAVENADIPKIKRLVSDLTQLLDFAEREYENN